MICRLLVGHANTDCLLAPGDEQGKSLSMEDAVNEMLRRSEDLNEALFNRLGDSERDASVRGDAVVAICAAAFEHAAGLRLLIANGHMTPALALMRLQYESLTRAMWLLYVAPDSAIEKLTAPLTIENEREAKGLPSQLAMLEQIRKGVGTKVPARAAEMLEGFRKISWHSLNSYVHAGIHVIRRQADGYPVRLILDVLRNSNALSTMAAMTLALLTDEATARSVSRIQPAFADCLPELLAAQDVDPK